MSQRPRRVRERLIRMSFVAIVVSTVALTAVGIVLPAGSSASASAKGQTAGLRDDYDRAEAAARATVDAARIKFGDDTLEVATACDDLLRALLLNGRGGAAATLSLAERTLKTKESLLGPVHPALATSLVNLGDALVAAGKYDRAITLLDRSVALRERDRSDTLDHADALDHLASALTAAGRYDAALSVLKRSLQTKKTLLNSESVEIARTLGLIGFGLHRRGDYESAAEPVRQAEKILRAANSEHPEYAETLNLVAQQFWFEGRLQESRAASERALALAERSLRIDHPTVARSLRLLAGTIADLGDFERSHALRERALAIVEREFGPDHYETAIYLNSAAMADLNLGDYLAARARLERAVATFETQFGPWHDYVATTRLNLALVDAYLGDYVRARREQARVIAIWERTLGRNHSFVALALTELALVYREQGRPAEALPLLARSLAIRQRSLGAQHRDVALTRVALAATQLQLGQIGAAEAQAARALRTWEQLDEPDAPDFATALALYAELQLRRGAIADAREYYEKALSIRAKVFGRTHPAFAEAQAGLALTQAAAGEFSSALGSAADAEQVSRNHLRLMLAHLPERQSLNYAASRPKGLDLVLSLVGSTPDAVAIGLEEAIRSRAMVLDEMAARRPGNRAREDTASLSATLAAARQRLANLLVRGPHEMPPARHAAIVEQARIESEIAEQKFAEQSLKFRAELNRINPGLQDVATAVPPGSALVSFIRYDRSVFRKPVAAAQSGVNGLPPVRQLPSYIALVMRPGVPPAAVPLGSAATIDARVSEWRQAIAATGGAADTSAAAATSSRISGTLLRRLVWDPLAINLSGAVRVFIVPDGSLSLVPFAALPIGQRSYLLETGPVIHYLSAERDLVAWSTPVSTDVRGLLAIGAPSFNDGTLFRVAGRPPQSSNLATVPTTLRGGPQICGGLQAITFEPLAGTLREVRELSDLWNAQELSDRDSPAARTLVGREANEGTFKREAHRYRVLHLATHGFFVGSSCAKPGTSGTRGVGGLSLGEKGVMENPLLLSGLALAGANRRANAGPHEEDGILTAEEVASLSLEGVEWAVLSACDTGIGEIRAGEGVLGLRRAFQIAGARTVVMSLWSVDDQAARAWMRALYEGRFQKRLSTAEAVHAASLKVLHDRRSRGESTQPFYWAAFVAAGDWR